LRSSGTSVPRGGQTRNPVELLPALGFVAIIAAGAVATRWAEAHFGQSGSAVSLFITGTFDVDAAIVTLSGLPVHALDRGLAATALAGTVIANMILKIIVASLYGRAGSKAATQGLAASALALMLAVGIRLFGREVL
jgi:uncharacterized membrane protein (DUF4010 family)